MAAWIGCHMIRIWTGGIYFEKQVKLHFARVFFACFSRSSNTWCLEHTTLILIASWYDNPFQINSSDNNDDDFVSPHRRRRRFGCGKGGKVYGPFPPFPQASFSFPGIYYTKTGTYLAK